MNDSASSGIEYYLAVVFGNVFSRKDAKGDVEDAKAAEKELDVFCIFL